MNKFNFSASQHCGLQNNGAHQLAMRHAMHIYQSNAVYTFIPKNGCSTMRLSVAIANGCIDGIEDGHWIHANNQTFNPSLYEAFKAHYTFVILRCPFRRLASVFLDKFVGKENEAWQFYNGSRRQIYIDDLTFEDFVKSINVNQIKNANVHWRPQVSFLLYQNYSDYFCLENFSSMVEKLSKNINFDVVDARSLTAHGTDKYRMISNEDFSKLSTFEISLMKRSGECPSHESLYSPESIQLVKSIYAEDVDLFRDKFGQELLLFPS